MSDVLGADAVEAVLAGVHAAGRGWAAREVAERARIVGGVAEVLRSHREDLARRVTSEMGKPVSEARAEVDKCAWLCEHHVAVAPQVLAPEPVEIGDDVEAWVAHEPLGVVLGVMPWNFPLWQLFRFAVPAVLAGNTVLVKPAPITTGSSCDVEALLVEAGLPRDVLRIVPLDEADVASRVATLLADDRVTAVSLTGSDRAGAAVAAQAGRHLKPAVLELGGSDPFVVLDDADLDVVVEAAVRSRFGNAGQSCLAAKRMVVHAGVADAFTDRLVDAVAALRVGDPFDETTEIGPMARADLRDELHRQVTASVDAGATLCLGGHPLDRPGSWYAPTVLADVVVDMPVMAEETFGPVAVVARVADDEEAVALARATSYGLGASVWTRDRQRGEAVARRLRSGAVFVNRVVASDPRLPFGGVGRSGHGRELGRHGLLEFVNVRSWVVGAD